MISFQSALEFDGLFLFCLINFEGLFDLFLQLIGRRQLDITEVALS